MDVSITMESQTNSLVQSAASDLPADKLRQIVSPSVSNNDMWEMTGQKDVSLVLENDTDGRKSLYFSHCERCKILLKGDPKALSSSIFQIAFSINPWTDKWILGHFGSVVFEFCDEMEIILDCVLKEPISMKNSLVDFVWMKNSTGSYFMKQLKLPSYGGIQHLCMSSQR